MVLQVESDFICQLRKEGPPSRPLKCDFLIGRWGVFKSKTQTVGKELCLPVQESLRGNQPE